MLHQIVMPDEVMYLFFQLIHRFHRLNSNHGQAKSYEVPYIHYITASFCNLNQQVTHTIFIFILTNLHQHSIEKINLLTFQHHIPKRKFACLLKRLFGHLEKV